MPFVSRPILLSAALALLSACGDGDGDDGGNPGDNQGGGYALAASPANPTLVRGQSGSLSITITATRTDYTGAIDLTAENLPTGMTATARTIAEGSTSTTLAFSTTASTPLGTQNVTIRGKATGLTDNTLTVPFNVVDNTGQAVTWASIATGYQHVCALTTAGKAWCWGSRIHGELGDGQPVTGSGVPMLRDRPYAVVGGLTFSTLSSGSEHTCGITTAGALYCWGSNVKGQIGDGGSTNGGDYSAYRTSPVAIMASTTWLSVSAGPDFTCAVATGGVTYCWGDNSSTQASGGQFGAPSTILTPRNANIGRALTKVAVGSQVACGLTSAGTVWCWGSTSRGRLGSGPTPGASGSGPQQVLGGPYSQVSTVGTASCAVATSGGLYCWGANEDGQLGFAASGNYNNDYSGTPLLVPGGQSWKQALAAPAAACGLTTAGAMSCWGLNNVGQAGIGSYTPRNPTPTAVTGGLTFQSMSPSIIGNFMCGVTTAGAAYCWGDNTSGRLGNTTLPASGTNAPARVENPL